MSDFKRTTTATRLSFELTDTHNSQRLGCGGVHIMQDASWPVRRLHRWEDEQHWTPRPELLQNTDVQLLVHPEMTKSEMLDALDRLRPMIEARFDVVKNGVPWMEKGPYPSGHHVPTVLHREMFARTGAPPIPTRTTQAKDEPYTLTDEEE